ncbi:MAG: hypothetical protein LBB76_08410 [Azoarcus sp.]|jgi:hypothetical protein|nr:hypothetical protein [Azoarcus sp.]
MSRSKPFTSSFLARCMLLATAALSSVHAQEKENAVQLVTAINGEISTLSLEEAAQLFLGHRTTLRDGTPVTLIDLPSGLVRNQFYQLLTGKNPVQVRAYWSRLVFSGRVRPPLEASNQAEARELLAKNPNAIGYLPVGAADAKLKVLFKLPITATN